MSANTVTGIHLYQHGVASGSSFSSAAHNKFKSGYLFFHPGLKKGAYRLSRIDGKSCLGPMCSNTFYSYSFGNQGKVGTFKVTNPKVIHIGSFKLKKDTTNLLNSIIGYKPGKFSIVRSDNPPSRKELLTEILRLYKAKKTDPIVLKRIQMELNKL